MAIFEENSLANLSMDGLTTSLTSLHGSHALPKPEWRVAIQKGCLCELFYFLTWVSHSHSPILQGSGSSAVGWSVQAHSERGVWKGRLSIILFTPLLSPEICSKRNCAVYSIVHCTTIMFCIVTSVEFSRTNQWTSVLVGRTTLPTEF